MESSYVIASIFWCTNELDVTLCMPFGQFLNYINNTRWRWRKTNAIDNRFSLAELNLVAQSCEKKLLIFQSIKIHFVHLNVIFDYYLFMIYNLLFI